jgi:hypothetical protein
VLLANAADFLSFGHGKGKVQLAREGEAVFASDCTVGLGLSLLSRVVREHDDGV